MKAASKANHNNSHHFIIPDDLDGCFLIGTGHVFDTNNIAEHSLAGKSHHSVSVVKYFLDSDSYKHKKHLPVNNALPFSITKSTKQTMFCDIVWRCLLGIAPLYLRELCCPLHSAMSSRSLISTGSSSGPLCPYLH